MFFVTTKFPSFLRPLKTLRCNTPMIKYFSPIPNYEEDLKLNGISVNNYIKKLQTEFEILNRDQTNKSRLLELQVVMQILNERKMLVSNIDSLKELLIEKDDGIRKLAEEEQSNYENKLEKLNKKLLESIVPADKDDLCDSIVLEVQAGVGGQEAMLFAKEIFDMYTNFIEYKGWEFELTDYGQTDVGGIRLASALVHGQYVFHHFKHEAGVHRVQRIPVTEKGGRIHTSTISVIALPQPTDIEINIPPSDLRIETKKASGAGGQHVNKTESAVRLHHLPTGIAVECQVDRSQIKNRKLALAKLKAILYQKKLDEQCNETEVAKKNQVNSRNRNEKIRTYNFNQDRITDHRIGLNVHNLKGFLAGGEQLNNLIKKLDKHYLSENLLHVINSSV